MNSIEDRLRDSLKARATDVEPSPVLWDRVQEKTRRRARYTFLVSVGAGMAAAAALAVIVPSLLDEAEPPRNPVVDQPPSVRPTEPGGALSSVQGMVTTDGSRIVVRDPSGTELGTVVDLEPGLCECEITDVAVSPASDLERVLGVYTVRAEGMWDQRWFEAVRDGAGYVVVDDYFQNEVQVAPDASPASRPAAAFSPDGSHVAWIEMPSGESSFPLLRAVAFTEAGPTGAPTVIELVDLPARGYRVEQWVSYGETDGRYTGELLATTESGDIEAYGIPVEWDWAGVNATTAPYLVDRGGDAVVDLVNLGDDSGYVLNAVGTGEGVVQLSLRRWSSQDLEDRRIDLPADLSRTSDVTAAWMEASGDAVLVGAGGRAYLVDVATSQFTEIENTVSSVAFLLGAPIPAAPNPAPTHEPTDVATNEAAYVAIEGLGDIVVYAPDGTPMRTLFESPCTDAEDCEFRPARIVVRPGSTLDDLTALVLWLGDGVELGYVGMTSDSTVPYTPFPDAHQPSQSVTGAGSLPIPVWSSDGAHVAWLEESVDTGEFTLRTIGWDGGPGTGDRADDNAAWTIDPSAAGAGEVDLDLVRWMPWGTAGTDETSYFVIRTHTDRGTYIAEGLPLERQPDGALALQEEGFGYDHIVEPHVVDTAPTEDGAWMLQVRGEGPSPEAANVAFGSSTEGSFTDHEAPAGFLEAVGDGWRAWIEAVGDRAYIGTDTGTTWVVEADGTYTSLSSDRLVHLAPVE